MKTTKCIAGLLLVVIGLASANQGFSQPPLPTLPAGQLLDAWDFSGTNFLSLRHAAPTSLTNVALVPTWAGNGLQVDDTNAAWITYAVVETGGKTNLDLSQGTLEMWFSSDWDSSDGIGNWGTLLQVGAWDTNLSTATGAWGCYISSDASTFYFSAQTNGVFTNYLNAPIAWYAGDWHQIVVTYSATNSALYLEGAFVTNGPGTSVIPSAAVLSNGFSIGSDGNTGLLQSRGVFNNIAIFNYPLDADTISNDYAYDSQFVYPLPFSGGFHTDDGPPSPGGGFGTNSGSGGGYTPEIQTYGSNDFYLAVMPLGANAYTTNTNSLVVLLENTTADMAYQLLSTTNLNPPVVWTVEQNLIGSEITNFTPATVAMTGRPTLFFKGLAYGMDSDGDGLPDWWENKYSTTGFPLSSTNADTGDTGIQDGYKMDSAGDGYNNLQKYQMGIPPGTWVTPPAPAGLTVTLNTNGTASLNWNASPGTVTQYIILRADPGGTFQPIATNSSTATSFVDSGSFTVGNPISAFSPGSTYEIQAVYAGGSSSYESSPMLGALFTSSLAVNAKLARGPYGRWQLVFSAIPSGVQNIAITYQYWDFWYDDGFDFGSPQTISVSNLVNGCYVIPDDVITNYVGYNEWLQYEGPGTGFESWWNLGDFDYAYIVFVQGLATNGASGPYVQAGMITQDAPYFMDGRHVLQESLSFLMQAAGLDQPFSAINQGYTQYFFTTYGTNFIEHSFIHPAVTDNEYYDIGGTYYIALDNTWPFLVDYTLDPWLYTTNPPPAYSWAPNDFTTPPAVLTQNFTYQDGPYWIAQDASDLAAVGASTSDGGQTVSVESGVHNLFGCAIESALGQDNGAFNSGTYYPPENLQVAPGASATFSASPLVNYYSQFQAPAFQTESYYFAPVNTPGTDLPSLTAPTQNYPLPLTNTFAVTNVSPLIIGAVGQPMIIGGWAKQSNTNSTAGIFAYLGQYFQTNAYKISNGVTTTNVTGIISPYGEFLPTEPGPTALITMPDLTTGHTGTSVVNVIKMQTDADHNSIMDLTFAGQDNTSENHPMVWWLNTDNDEPGSNGGLDKDVNAPALPDYGYGQIRSLRNLEDFARLWICGVPTLPTNQNYSVQIGWSQIDSGAPELRLYWATETNGGIGYLTNITTASQQIIDYNFPIGEITPTNSLSLPISVFTNNVNRYFLFEAGAEGKGALTLTISQGTNIIAQTSTWFDFHDITDLYEQALVTNVIQTWPEMVQQDTNSSFQVLSYPTASTGDSNQLVVFVHGWRMTDFDWNTFSQSMFKRLYWQGYQGKFASLRWPTRSGDTDTNGDDILTFNRSEHISFESGTGAALYFYNLRQRFADYTISVCSHSMGGILMMEALKELAASSQAPLDNYVLMQAAVPAQCYDTTVSNLPSLVDWDLSIPTPNTYSNYAAGIDSALRGGNIINFFNTNDYALATATKIILGSPQNVSWEGNEALLKPLAFFGYGYIQSNSLAFVTTNAFTVGFGITNLQTRIVTDPLELMPFVARPRCKAAGAQPGVGSIVNGGQLDLAQFGFGREDYDHSGQFNRDIQTVQVQEFYFHLYRALTQGQP